MSAMHPLTSKLPFGALVFFASTVLAQPKITAFTPAGGTPGTTIIITGSGFNATPSNNTVYFGSVKAAVTGGSAGSLTATVPVDASYQPISVLNNATGLTAYSSRPFLPTAYNPARSGITPDFYQKRLDLPTGSVPFYIVTYDINSNGIPDFIVANANSNTVSVQGNSASIGEITGSYFPDKVDFAVGLNPRSVAVGDVDGDGRPDIVTANSDAGTVSVLRNTATEAFISASSFAAKVDFPVGSNPFSVAISDLDGDGKPELVVANLLSGTVSVLRNTTSTGPITPSSFAPRVDFTAGDYPRFVVAGDLNADNKPEIIVANERSNSVSVLRNVSSPGTINSASFAGKVDLAAGASPVGIATGDIDDDGRLDLVVASYASGSASVIRNQSASNDLTGSSFAGAIDFSTGPQPFFVAVSDADGDGKPDIITANSGSNTISVLRNLADPGIIGPASFAGKVDFAAGGYPTSVAVSDVDGDGTPEALTTNAGFNNISIIKAGSLSPVPVISSVSATSGPIGTSVRVVGNNFSPSGSIIYFGAVRATVQFASSNYLSVVVPAGATYQPFSILNTTTGLTGYAARPFAATFPNPYGTGIPSCFYRPKTDFAAGTVPFFVTAGDLDGDGKSDMVVANAGANTVSVLRNTTSFSAISAASFASGIDLPTGADPRSIALGDLDGDGKPEIVVANSAAGTVSVLRNTATTGSLTASSFAPKVDFAAGSQPFSVAIGDIDSDGKPDLVVADLSSGTVSVLRNVTATGSITASSFASKADFAAGMYPRFVAISDLNGDSKPDIAVVNERSNSVSVLRNTAVAGVINASSFAPMAAFATGSSPDCLAATDINGDSKPDLVVVNYGSNSVSVLRNTTSAGAINATSFAGKIDFETGVQPFFVATADADGDGKPDLVVANASSNNLSVLRNTTEVGSINASSFAPHQDFGVGGYPVSAAVGDLDGDNVPELMAANAGSNSLSVLKIQALQGPAPVVTSFTPASGPVGTTVTITGDHFNATPGNNTVYFGAVKVPVIGGSTTSLTVTIPAGVTYQPVSVLDNVTGLAGYSSQSYITTFTNPFGTGIPSNYYLPKVSIPTSDGARGLATGDLDGDGKVDLVTTGGTNNPLITIYRNISTTGNITASSFAPGVNFPVGGYPGAIRLTDIDGDGKLDIVVVNFFGFSFSVLRNTSTAGSLTAASFAPRVDFPTSDYPSVIVIKDEDGDGKPDIEIYYGVGSPNAVSIYHNTSVQGSITSTSFSGRADYAGTRPGQSPLLGDVDGDGRVDRVMSSFTSTGYVLSVERNTGTNEAPVYEERKLFSIGDLPASINVADLDGDGIPELAMLNGNTYTIAILKVGSPSSVSAVTAVHEHASLLAADAEQPGRNMQLYPNPTRGEFVLQLFRSTGTANLEIFNESGTVVEKKTVNITSRASSLRLNLRNQPAGIYYVKVTGIDGIQVTKVVVRR